MSESPEIVGTGTYKPVETGTAAAHTDVPRPPKQIGRYRIEELLGQGGFGQVFLAYDDQLGRRVAVKIPHPKLVSSIEDAKVYLVEARTVAGLDHPHIVPVYDVGSSEDHPCFIVSKLIEGSTLAKRISQDRPSVAVAVQLVATVADTLHYAHRQGLVHRDVKPGNILLDSGGKPYVTDFGLALKDEDFGRGPKYPGTPAYMSPEQARGEGHRVDGRSDIFSLGVILYELLTGRRPFRAKDRKDMLELVATLDPRPPRQIDDGIPKELERICLKALAKRASERYTTAKDFADDLLHFLQESAGDANYALNSVMGPIAIPASGPGSGSALPAPSTATSHQQVLKIIPKGLRSFEEQDADFFLELLPGPRDRKGLPETIRFWKNRIEESDPNNRTSVGLIYGPSGCGKSSLVKAGLLPRLSEHVVPIYVEATAEQTESRLHARLQNRFPALSPELPLSEFLAALRRAPALSPTQKLLVVLDQFEQWLHSKSLEQGQELIQALRQCDGSRVQCLLMVRDDFWMALTRFMRELEIPLLDGQNCTAVDLFPQRHAEKVLAAFGSAFGAIPENTTEITTEQKQFLQQAMSGLAQDGKVICVRLALFAEMMKSKPWTPATLKRIGGMAGVGATFLEETFCSPSAPPRRRHHQKAARAVLKALLPTAGADIKGHMRSGAELATVSGYAGRPNDFEDLLRLLDNELRLITPTDPQDTPEDPGFQARPPERFYQLTHDYLVPSLCDWLNRKQKQTMRGRAEIRLTECAELWTSKPEKRFLPSLAEWLRIRVMTPSSGWTLGQGQMMRKADKFHLSRLLTLAVCLLLLGLAGWEYDRHMQAWSIRDRLLSAAVAETPAISQDIKAHRNAVVPLLQDTLQRESNANRQLVLRLVLVEWDPSQVNSLYEPLLQAAPQDFTVIRRALSPYKAQLTEKLWSELTGSAPNIERRFRAACALVDYAPSHPQWNECAAVLVNGLIAENPMAWQHWKIALEPVRIRLLPTLAASLEKASWGPAERRAITEFYRVFSAGQPVPFAPLEQRLSAAENLKQADQAKSKANVAAALVSLGDRDVVWPYLTHNPSPTFRSYLIDRLGSSGADPRVLIERLGVEKDIHVRRALILSLGGFPTERLPDLGATMIPLYQTDPDPGIHAAAGWVIRRLGPTGQVERIDQKLAAGRIDGSRRWFVNKQKQTFSIIDGSAELLVNGRGKVPVHRFAIGSTEVTAAQFRAFRKNHQVDGEIATTLDSPVNNICWYDAAEYCNWLSKEEALPENQWCYLRNNEGLLDPIPDYQQRMGYRLPTEAEWEFACRAGAKSRWYFGEADEELIGKYAWWFGNAHANGVRRSFPVASLRPNDFGLFDMHGNLPEMCQDFERPAEHGFFKDVEYGVRGGSYLSSYGDVACDHWFSMGRKVRLASLGFRVARTLP